MELSEKKALTTKKLHKMIKKNIQKNRKFDIIIVRLSIMEGNYEKDEWIEAPETSKNSEKG